MGLGGVREARVEEAQSAQRVRLAGPVADGARGAQRDGVDLHQVVPEAEPVEVEVEADRGAPGVVLVAVRRGLFDDGAQDVPLGAQPVHGLSAAGEPRGSPPVVHGGSGRVSRSGLMVADA